MLILLPPSEGKTSPADGAPVDLDSLVHGELTPARRKVLDALAEASSRDDALTLLGVGASLAEEVSRNTELLAAPAAPGARVYTGVLYAAANLAGVLDGNDDVARGRLADVLTVSALWGLVRPADRVPAYRLSMSVDLPGVGPLARFWRPELAVLDERAHGDVVVDCRSSSYGAAWRVPDGAEHVQVKVLRERAGRRTVVSHHAKHTRGLLTGHLLRRPAAPPRSAAELLDAAGEMVGPLLHDAALVPGSKHATLELVVTD